MQLWLRLLGETKQTQQGSLFAELFLPGDQNHPIDSYQVHFQTIAAGEQITIPFTPRTDPPRQEYVLRLSTQTGTVQVMGRAEDVRPDYQIIQDSANVAGDAAVRLTYDYDAKAFVEDIRSALTNLWLAVPVILVIWLPGAWILRLSGADQNFDAIERISYAVALSIAIIPILLIWTSSIGLQWSAAAVWIAAILLILDLARRYWLLSRSQNARQHNRKFDLHLLAMVVIFLISLSMRLIMVRDLAAPPWVDSVHHAMLTRLILESGKVPASFDPYLELNAANYHPGFHAGLAAFEWLTRLDLSRGLLIYGQVLNALSVFAVYLFTTTLTRSRTAGVIAALATGCFTTMPTYYTSWGRYSQLAGLIILPAAFGLVYHILKEQKFNPIGWKSPFIKAFVLAAIACGGLFLTHYRVAAFFGALLIAWSIVEIFRALIQKRTKETIWAMGIGLILVATFSILLTMPVWPETVQSLLLPKLDWTLGKAELFEDFTWGYLTNGYGTILLTLAGVGLVWGMLQRRSFSFILILWIVLMFGLANLKVFHLPGGGFINNASVEISLFMPISLLCGYLLAWILEGWQSLIPQRFHWFTISATSAAGIFLAILGVRSLVTILNPVTFLFREPDRPAMEWITSHIPLSETILINSFNWGYGLYAGNDGGYWIIPLAGRKTLPPPVLYGLNPSIRDIYSTISSQVIGKGNQAEELYEIMVNQGIHYIYIGARGGPISPQNLQQSNLFETLYHHQGTWVFKSKQ